MAKDNYNNNKNRNNNNSNKNYITEQTKSDLLAAMQNFIKQSIANDKQYSSTVTSILPSLGTIGKNGILKFNGVKNNDSVSDEAVLEGSLGSTPIVFALTERIDFGKIYGHGLETRAGEAVPFFGDIYDEYELKQLIQDVNSRIYKDYYNQNMSTSAKEEYYQVVIEVLAASLALYSLIVSAWSFQNMKESEYKLLGREGKVANLFAQMAWKQQGTADYPYQVLNQDNTNYVPFQMPYSNAAWLQNVLSKLDAVWLPEQTARFWRELFGGVFMLTPHESVDRGAIQLVKFIPQFTYDFNDLSADENLYNSLFVAGTDPEEFEAVLDSLSSSVKDRLSMYPWLEAALEALGCNFHGFKYYLDGSGNIQTEKSDDFTRALTAKNVNIVYDSTDDVRNALQAISLINYRGQYAEEETENSLPYLYMPYEICSQNKVAPMMGRIFDSFVVSDVRNTMLANKTNFAALLKGNVTLPILHILVASLDSNTRNPDVVKNPLIRILVAPGYRYFFNVSVANALANICTYYDILQDSCTIPMTKVILKGAQGSAPTSYITQASVWPVESLSMYDGYDPTGYADVDRARAARRYLLMYEALKSGSDNKRGKKDEKKPSNNQNSNSNNNNNSNNGQNNETPAK